MNANAVTTGVIGLLTVIGAVASNVLLIVFWLDGKIDFHNAANIERFDKVYEIIVQGEGKIIDAKATIETFIKEHSERHSSPNNKTESKTP